MTAHNNISTTSIIESNIYLESLEEKRMELVNAGFELLEIWHKDDQPSSELWRNANTLETIKLFVIITQKPDEDASRKEIIDELVDLWVELRAIRKSFDNRNEEDLYSISTEFNALDLFYSKLEEYKEEKALDTETWNFLFNETIDESIFAYFDLSLEDRKAICH